MLTREQKEQIIKRMQERGVKTHCPMCGQNNFVIIDGYFNNALQNNLKSISLGGSGIPTIAIVCSNCGFVSQHALGSLGLLSDENSEQEKNGKNKQQ